MPKLHCLVLSGGGAKGAYGAGAAKALFGAMELWQEPPSNLCLVGTSAGALNAAMLACHPPHKLTALWSRLRASDILDDPGFTGKGDFKSLRKVALRWARRKPTIQDGKKLRDLIKRELGDVDFGKLRSTRHLVVTATDASRARTRSFFCSDAIQQMKTADAALAEGRQRLTKFQRIHDVKMLIDVLVASASVPVVFPPVEFADGVFVDGGVGNNTPTAEAAQIVRQAAQILSYEVGRTYCVMQTGSHLHEEPSVSMKAMLPAVSRIYDVFQATQIEPLLIGWEQINKNVARHQERVKMFNEFIDRMASTNSNARNQIDEIRTEFNKVFSESDGGSVPRREMQLLRIQPSVDLGGLLDFDKEHIDKNMTRGHGDMLQALTTAGLLSPEQSAVFRQTSLLSPIVNAAIRDTKEKT